MNQQTNSVMQPAASSAARSTRDAREFWLFTQDHRRLALLYAVVVGLALVAGAFLGFGLSIQPLASTGSGAAPEVFRRMYSMHGLVMAFLVALPALPMVLGNWMLPEQLGLERMLLPRLNLLAFQIFFAGALLFLVALLFAPLESGFSLDLPFALSGSASLGWGALGIATVLVSYACSSANLLATVFFGRRADGTSPAKPFFAWAIAASSLVQLLATPVLLAALVVLYAERAGAADVLGSSPAADVRFAQWFWIWGHPAFSAMLIAALGVVGTIVADHQSTPRPASRTSIASLFAIAVVSCASFGVHVLGRGTNAGEAAGASALALLAGVPFAVIVLEWMLSLAAGRTQASASLAYALCFLVLLCVGGMAGVFLAVLPAGAHLANSCFSTAQFHYLVIGGTLVALLGGLYHGWKRWFGVEARQGWAVFGCFLLFAGVNLAFLPQFLLGYLGQPRRSTELVEGAGHLSLYSACGSGLIVVALVIAAWNLLSSLMDRPHAEGGAAS